MINMIKGREKGKKDSDNPDGLMNMQQISTGERDLLVWRRKLDDLKAKTMKKEEHLTGMHDRFKEIQKQQTDLEQLSKKANLNDDSNICRCETLALFLCNGSDARP